MARRSKNLNGHRFQLSLIYKQQINFPTQYCLCFPTVPKQHFPVIVADWSLSGSILLHTSPCSSCPFVFPACTEEQPPSSTHQRLTTSRKEDMQHLRTLLPPHHNTTKTTPICLSHVKSRFQECVFIYCNAIISISVCFHPSAFVNLQGFAHWPCCRQAGRQAGIHMWNVEGSTRL